MFRARYLLVCLAASLTVAAGCSKDEDDLEETDRSEEDDGDEDEEDDEDDDELDVEPVDEPATIEARILREVDGADPMRKDGRVLSVEGSKAVVLGPTDDAVSSHDDMRIGSSPSGDTKIALAHADTPTDQLAAATRALGYEQCQWAAEESASIGKQRLPAMVADGICMKNDELVRTGYAVITDHDLLIVGGFDDAGGDATSLYDTFRTARVPTGGKPGGIAACCRSIEQNMVSAPPQHVPYYQGALNLCRGAQAAGGSLAPVQGALASVGVPLTCQ